MARQTKGQRTKEYAGLLRALEGPDAGFWRDLSEPGRGDVTKEEFEALVRAYLAAVKETADAAAALAGAVTRERKALRRVQRLAVRTKRLLRSALPTRCEVYDIPPEKPRRVSSATKAAAAEKARARSPALASGPRKRRRRRR